MIRLHPLTGIMFTILLFFITLLYSHPLYIGSILIFTILGIGIAGEKKKIKDTIKYSLYMVILIILINPLMAQSGRSILYKSPRIPMVGRIKITWEAVAFGSNMALKMICILLIFLLYSVITNRDDIFSFFSKYAHKLTLTMSMTINLIHRLRLEMARVRDVMILRGVNFQEKNLRKKMKAYYPLLKVVFVSSLEGSLERAEALYARKYGNEKRTTYISLRMKKIDYIFHGINLLLLFLVIYGMTRQRGVYAFYPVLEKFHFEDIRFLLLIDLIFAAYGLLLWRCKKWKFVK
ncbi:energy-coupling factor transporter transmembrane component T [Clostridiaceae bacterium 35-E11]